MIALAVTEVLCGQCACFVDQVDQNGSTESGQALAGDRVSLKDADPFLASGLEGIDISSADLVVDGGVKDDGLDFLEPMTAPVPPRPAERAGRL